MCDLFRFLICRLLSFLIMLCARFIWTQSELSLFIDGNEICRLSYDNTTMPYWPQLSGDLFMFIDYDFAIASNSSEIGNIST